MHAWPPEAGGLRFHHTGCLVPDIEAARARFEAGGAFGSASPIYDVTDQQVRVCFIGPPGGGCLELVQTLSERGALPALVRKGHTFYHAAYLSGRFDAACVALTAAGLRQVNSFVSEAFHGARCAFFLDEGGLLFEIIESLEG